MRTARRAARPAPDRVELALDRDLPLIDADAAQLERAFANLLENARRHSGATRSRSARGSSAAACSSRIVDRGPGIPPASRSGSSSRSTAATDAGDHAGSGLGLAIVKRVRRGQRRRVHVESLPGPGHASSSSSRSPPASTARCDRRVSAAGRRVLVCDDEPQILRALKVVLREAGFEAVPAETAEEALDARRGAPARRGDHRPRAARRRRRRGLPPPARVERDADPRAVGVGEEDAEGARARGRRRRLRHQAVRPARARRAPARRRCGAPAPAADEPAIRVDGLEIDLAARTVRRDGEEVHLTPIEFDLLRVARCATAGG